MREYIAKLDGSTVGNHNDVLDTCANPIYTLQKEWLPWQEWIWAS